MPAKAKWKKVGWRSLKHTGSPLMVVRFSNGVGKMKLLESSGVDFAQLDGLMREATEEWTRLNNETKG